MWGPRSATITIYGDYVRHKGGEIGIGSLIKLLGDLGLSEQAVRSAVSRMCRAGLLQVRQKGRKSYYSLTSAGFDMLNKGAQRIFERNVKKWDRNWTLVVYFIPEQRRELRHQLRTELGQVGFGPLSAAAWISPHDLTREATDIADKLHIKDFIQVFRAKSEGFMPGGEVISRCWELERIKKRYSDFMAKYSPKLERHKKRLKVGETPSPSECFVERFRLLDEYRRLPFFDPDLPEELLPSGWPRSRATSVFNDYYALLAASANEYFDSVFGSY